LIFVSFHLRKRKAKKNTDRILGLKNNARTELGAQRKNLKAALNLSELSIFRLDNI